MATFTSEQQALRAAARQVAESVLKPSAAETDAKRRYPEENLKAVGSAGLMGLLAPPQYGGRGGSLVDLAIVCEQLGWGCASTGMCFLMHSCGTAVIASKATPEQGEQWLRKVATGEFLTTLAFSERGTGAHFYAPEIKAQQHNGGYRLSGRKSFVTSGGHAELYPVLVNASGQEGLDALIVTKGAAGVSFDGEWEGLGMAGNSSIAMSLENVDLPASGLLGQEGDGQEIVFNVVAPTFLVGLASVNIGIAQAALDAAVEHAKTRKYATGQSLAQIPAIQINLANMGIQTEQARQLVQEAARAASAGEETALPLVMQAKIAATEAAKAVTETAMQVGGGLAYSRRLPIERHWRDARAGSVMAPTNDVLKEWLGKVMTEQPLF